MVPPIQEREPELAELCQRFKVRRLYLFGSAARGALRPDSDLDFLVSMDDSSPAEYTENYFGLAHALERLFGRRVGGPTSITSPNCWRRWKHSSGYDSMAATVRGTRKDRRTNHPRPPEAQQELRAAFAGVDPHGGHGEPSDDHRAFRALAGGPLSA